MNTKQVFKSLNGAQERQVASNEELLQHVINARVNDMSNYSKCRYLDSQVPI